MSNRNLLKQFASGTPLAPADINHLIECSLLTKTDNGGIVLTRGGILLLNSDLPPGDSYLPPPVRTGQWQPMSAAQLERRIAQDNLNQQMRNALDKQEGGAHYKDHAIQPIEYIHANKLGFIEGNVVKYITRHASKGGAEDVRKVIHYCELLLQLQYGEKA